MKIESQSVFQAETQAKMFSIELPPWGKSENGRVREEGQRGGREEQVMRRVKYVLGRTSHSLALVCYHLISSRFNCVAGFSGMLTEPPLPLPLRLLLFFRNGHSFSSRARRESTGLEIGVASIQICQKKSKDRLRDPHCKLQSGITQPILRLFRHICTAFGHYQFS